MKKNRFTYFLIAAICLVVLFPDFAYAQIDSQPELSAIYNADNSAREAKKYEFLPSNFTTVKQSAQDLLAKGCKLVELDSNGEPIVKKTGTDQYYFVPKAAKNIVQNLPDGRKASFPEFYSCPKVAAEFFIASQPRDLVWYLDILVGIVDGLLWLVDGLVNFAMYLISELFMPLLTQGKFIQHDIVKAGWPFVQGIANLGFIFALLYIALATTLRLESVGTSIQRLLPKLLIGALLVNFSLVIGGLVIDASRLMMATEIKLAAGPGVTAKNFYDKLLKATRGYETIASSVISDSGIGKNTSDYDYALGYIVARIRTTILSSMLVVGLFIVSINLFVRYIALLILLTFSPLAYVAIALPQTNQYFTQWWQLFIKWVMYGPIVLFFLILIIKIQSTGFATTSNKGLMGELVHFLIVVALLFIGNSVSKKAAGMGSDAIMGFAAKNKRAAAIGAATVATGGLAAPILAAALSSRSARDFYKGTGSNIGAGLKSIPGIKQASKFLAPGKRDKDGKLLAGQSSFGSTLAGFTSSLDPKNRLGGNSELNKVINANSIAAGRATNSDTFDFPAGTDVRSSLALTANELKKGNILKIINDSGSQNIKFIIENGTQSQRMAIASNKNYLAGLKPSDINKLQQTIQGLQTIDDGAKAKIMDRMFTTIESIDKK